ncbi:MAG: hypothetical protein ACOCTT_04040 [archaeon]
METYRLIDQTPIRTRELFKYPRGAVEKVLGRWKVAHARCPNCDRYITIYKDDLNSYGTGTRKAMKCTYCEFNRVIDFGDDCLTI